MGSKFSKPYNVQKPPAVCKAPPPPSPIPPPYWQDVPLLSYINWNYPSSSVGLHVTGPISMIPDDVDRFHLGEIILPDDTITLEMTNKSSPILLDFETIHFIGGSPVESFNVVNVVPQNLDPFDSGLITLFTTPAGDMIYCRVWW